MLIIINNNPLGAINKILFNEMQKIQHIET